MASMNRVFLIGNLTRDPEVRQTPSGTPVADLRMGVNEKFKSRDGQASETHCFVDVVAWDSQAQNCGQYLGKGSLIAVEGKLQFEEWQTDAGEKRSRLRVRAQRIQFLGRPRNGQNGNGSPATPPDGDNADDMPF
ncbi:MAG: single-stranded DNA-binding protein [Lentisphaerae bacterium]|nr:single-stranded DNA-binding protein [Lentisphaerota bacterium]